MRIWAAPFTSLDPLHTVETGAGEVTMAFGSETRLVTVEDRSRVRIWDLADGQGRPLPTNDHAALAAPLVGPDGRWLAVLSERTTVLVWDPGTGDAVAFGCSWAGCDRRVEAALRSAAGAWRRGRPCFE